MKNSQVSFNSLNVLEVVFYKSVQFRDAVGDGYCDQYNMEERQICNQDRGKQLTEGDLHTGRCACVFE